ncbi:hypothetical protein GQF01_26170 [Paenibacillus sp. 5J-6]|uniref:Intracellular proteinase inhibitor BsuPI domain-containing protein n=1 Tax=Paenibacillus silvestris TaxID=2606219 RepID=A0A6L8V7K1_9BACL|nr:BsuPI-related putative proteinase inhibitor [Paenibacillus silvestris]MZQ85612.1 hypothetical protein [Paenibacillus silvestris]
MGIGKNSAIVLLSVLLLVCPTSVNDESKPHETFEPVRVELAVNPDPEVENELQKKQDEQSKSVAGLFKTSLEVLNEDGKLNVNFNLQNVSGKEQRISYGSGQQYDIFIYNEKKEEIYRWSINRAFTQALIIRNLKKDDKLIFNEEWNLKNKKRHAVPPGKYTIEVEVMIDLNSEGIVRIHPDDLTAKTIFEVK